MKSLSILPFFFIIFILSACGPNYIYEKSYNINEEGWTYEDTLNFEIDIADTVGLYNLYLELEHTTEYKFQNLYTRIFTEFPSGERLQKEVSLELAYKGGAWKGDCNKKVCHTKIPIQERAFFNIPGKHVITLEQFMRESPISGIKKIAFKVENTGEKRN